MKGREEIKSKIFLLKTGISSCGIHKVKSQPCQRTRLWVGYFGKQNLSIYIAETGVLREY